MNSETRACQNCKNDFTIEPDDFAFYEKIQVPPPTFCPECRMIRRMAWRNNRSLHKRDCDLCGQSIVTIYNPEVPFTVYCNPCWFGDEWNPLDYGQEYDFSRSFFEQWFELWKKVPKYARWAGGGIKNSDYSNNIFGSSNCYLSYSIVDSEDLMYCENVDYGRSTIDSFLAIKPDMSYEVQGSNCYHSMYLSQSQDCINCKFCFDCSNCQDCFMSSNLRNKKYVFRNVQLSKDEYEKAILLENTQSRKKLNSLVEEWKHVIEGAVHKYSRIVASENTTGNFVRNSKDAKKCYMSHELENTAYCLRSFRAKDSYDTYGYADGELAYETHGCSFGASRCNFSTNSNGCQSIFYTAMSQNSNNIFGGVSLRKSDYCILNKQYSKEEYYVMIEKIKKHMNEIPYIDKKGRSYGFGEFFPVDFSPFGYNESQAHDFFQITEEEAKDRGYNWYVLKEKNYQITTDGFSLPDLLVDASNDILNEVIRCIHAGTSCNQQCTQAFRITPDELDFYRKMNIALPQLCPNCRYYERLLVLIQPLKLWHRQCMCDQDGHDHEGKCANEFETSYAPDRPEKVYCESCYQKEVL